MVLLMRCLLVCHTLQLPLDPPFQCLDEVGAKRCCRDDTVERTHTLSALYRMDRVELTGHFAYFLRVYHLRELVELHVQRCLLRVMPLCQPFLHFLHTRVGLGPSIDFTGKDDSCRRHSPDH